MEKPISRSERKQTQKNITVDSFLPPPPPLPLHNVDMASSILVLDCDRYLRHDKIVGGDGWGGGGRSLASRCIRFSIFVDFKKSCSFCDQIIVVGL